MGTSRNGSVRRRIEFDAAMFVALDRLAKDRMQTAESQEHLIGGPVLAGT